MAGSPGRIIKQTKEKPKRARSGTVSGECNPLYRVGSGEGWVLTFILTCRSTD